MSTFLGSSKEASTKSTTSIASSISSTAPLSEAQQNALEQMRTTFSSKVTSTDPAFSLNDRTYLRYLRARNFDFDKAVIMLNATLQWRVDFGLKDMHEWMDVVRVENECGKIYLRGFTRDGSIIVYMTPRLENSKNHEGDSF